MKPDERDIICEQDYTPLSNAELVAHIETYARLMHSTPLSDGEWLDDIIGPARVLLARAEAAAALAAERAANTWRPVTADWPPRNQRVVISAPGASWADVARKQHDGEEYVWQLKNGHMLDFESATVAIPLPPAPAPQEATP